MRSLKVVIGLQDRMNSIIARRLLESETISSSVISPSVLSNPAGIKMLFQL